MHGHHPEPHHHSVLEYHRRHPAPVRCLHTRRGTRLPAARGKAVKIGTQLLPFLQPAQEYRLILTHRNLEEVIPSERAMLQRLGRTAARLADRDRAYVAQLVRIRTWLWVGENSM